MIDQQSIEEGTLTAVAVKPLDGESEVEFLRRQLSLANSKLKEHEEREARRNEPKTIIETFASDDYLVKLSDNQMIDLKVVMNIIRCVHSKRDSFWKLILGIANETQWGRVGNVIIIREEFKKKYGLRDQYLSTDIKDAEKMGWISTQRGYDSKGGQGIKRRAYTLNCSRIVFKDIETIFH